MRVGFHKWDPCQNHSGVCYKDNTVGEIRYFPDAPDRDRPFVCHKCGKTFESLEDADDICMEKGSDDRPLFIMAPPGFATDIYNSRGVVIGSVVAVIRRVIDKDLPHAFEVIPKMTSMNAVLSCVVARMKIAIPTTIKKSDGDRVFSSKKYVYVLVDRATHEPVSW